MLRALHLVDDDDAHDHLLKLRKLSEPQLAEVVNIAGVVWLATEADLLKSIPYEIRPAFRKLAQVRSKMRPTAEIAGAELHPEPPFFDKRAANRDTVSAQSDVQEVTYEPHPSLVYDNHDLAIRELLQEASSFPSASIAEKQP